MSKVALQKSFVPALQKVALNWAHLLSINAREGRGGLISGLASTSVPYHMPGPTTTRLARTLSNLHNFLESWEKRQLMPFIFLFILIESVWASER
jgi:hypothetical protein